MIDTRREMTDEESAKYEQHFRDLKQRMKDAGLTSFEGVIENEDGTFTSMGEDD